MGQQQGVMVASRGPSVAEWDAKSTKSVNSFSTSKRFRRKLRKSLRLRTNRSCRDLSATFQYNSSDHAGFDQLNLNTASEDELMTLPGISRQTAQNIVSHRSAIGGFSKVEDLALVSGVGANRMEMLRFDICVANNNTRINRGLNGCPALSLESLNGTSTRCSGVTPVNVNTASMFELMSVPGLTQEMAAGICHIREKKGHFKSIDSLRKVKGMSSIRLALLRPRLCVDATCPSGSVDDNGSADTSDSMTIPSGLDTRPSTSSGARGSPSISLNSRRCRRTVASAFTSKNWDSEIDYDIYKLISHLAVRPIVARSEVAAVSQNRIRIALWDLEKLNDEKATNLGVQEVLCRTLLENDIGVLVCHDVESLSAGDCLIAELNQPLLSRVAAWEPQERRWHQIFPSITQNSMENESPKLQNGSANVSMQNGHCSPKTEKLGVDTPDSVNKALMKVPENRSGILYAAANGLRHLDYKLVQLRHDLPPALIANFEVGGSLKFSVVSVDLGGLGTSAALGAALPSLIERLATEIGQNENVIVCGNFITSPTDEALDELTRVGFHLLHPIASRDHIFHEHLHVWCSSGARSLCCHSEAETIRTGLSHPMIPKGSWHWGGTVSSHKPVFIELNLPTANGAILAHGQVLLNGMVSVD